MNEVKIETKFIKLDQFLKFENLVISGGEAKSIIQDGMVKVNGNVEFARGKKLHKGDTVEVFNQTYKII
ncbi:MAG: RNA-binding S4 domain-containing protein [Caulobacteraceae bacterium]